MTSQPSPIPTSHILEKLQMEPGLLVAYVALGIMAVVPIHFGSFSALKHLPRRKPRLSASHPDYSSSEDEAPTETLSKEDAYWFPIMGSAVLFGLYMVFKLFNKDYINYLLTAYFAVIGVGALTNTLEASIRGISGWKEAGYHIRLVRREKGTVSPVLLIFRAFSLSFHTSSHCLSSIFRWSNGLLCLN